jgi:hypothetical protein
MAGLSDAHRGTSAGLLDRGSGGHGRGMTLTFRNVSSPRLRIFSDGERDVARIYKSEHQKDWTWSVFVIVPARPGITNGHEVDPKEARRKLEEAWAYAKEHGEPAGNHIKIGALALTAHSRSMSHFRSNASRCSSVPNQMT